MAIQYYMRAFNTALSKYVDWVVNDTPDSTGAFSGFPSNQLTNITVNRIVQSKVSNFLKQNQSLGGTDGYFFHVNSYDWKNATAPILPPTNLVGFAVERGIASVSTLGGATNATPIVITTSIPHGLATGQIVTISGVTGNVAANGTWPIIVTSPTNFSLVGSAGTGTYNAGTGTAYLPNNMPTLAWDETNQLWRFFSNTNGDGTTIGPSQSVKVNNFLVDGYIAIGPDPADTGPIRLSNNTFIFSEANPPGSDVQLIGADTLNRIKLGVNVTDIVYDPGVLVVDGYIQHDGTGSNTAQTTGFIREQNSTNIIAFRGTAALAGSDIVALASSSNNVVVGDSVNTGVVYNTSAGSFHQFQVNSAGKVEIGDPFIRFFASGLASPPTIFQSQAAVNISGQTLTLQAQNGGTGTSNGGVLALTSGTGSGTGPHGTVDLLTGGILQMRIFPDANAGLTNGVNNNNSILYFQNALRFDTAISAPIFTQDQVNATSTNGQILTVQAQNAIGATSIGGNLNLSSGTGTTKAGQVSIQTGTVPQIVIIPGGTIPAAVTQTSDLTVIAGNLEVKGTLTTIDSTSVDIIGRVIHANWADPVASPNVGVPSQIAGYSIHRGNVSGIARDGAALIWTEGSQASGADGYWSAITIPGDGGAGDGYTISNSLNILGIVGKDFSASADPNPVLGYMAAAGSFRTYNNVPTVVGRTNLAATTLTATGLTNGSATLPLTPITVVDTSAFTTSGSLLIQSSAGQQLVTYTGKTGTSFTGVTGGTGTIVTGGIVSQTNNSTTFNGTNGTTLPTASITVVSTVGFPSSGTLRIAAQTTNLSTAPLSVQNITYTSTDATHFLGCTGGTGFLFVGDTVTLSPIPGTLDLVLLGTDFGNRILHGSPTANTGHIFNTPSGLLPPYIPYDFQVNSVTQVQLAQTDIDASGFTESIQIGPTVSNPRLVQQTLQNTGTTNGFNLGVFAQSGQQQTGATANNNGGQLFLVSGAQGTGGSGAAGIDGYVELRTGFTSKMRVFPTVALSAADNNSILYFENLFRVDLAQTNPTFRQDTTGAGTGQVYTIQAQNAATTGGNLVLTSGTGSSAANAGQVKLETGGIDREIIYPTGSPALPQGPSNTTYTEFRDTAQAVFINPVSAGIASLGFASTVTGAQIAQVSTASTPSAPMTVQSQVTTATSGQGGNLVLIGGNATGTTSTGGNVNIVSGSGTSTNGVVNIQIGGTQAILFNNTDSDGSGFSEVITIASTIGTPRIFQASTASASGTILALMAQNAATTGGPLQLHSGTGATNDGYINLTTGTTVKMTIYPTTAVSAANNNSIQIFENKFRFDTAQTTPLIRQDDKTANGGTGETFTIQAQNETGTTSNGGNIVITSGTGTTVAGNTQLQTGGVDRVVVHPTFTEFRDTAEALRITPVSAGTTQITFAATDTAAQINQTLTASTPSANMTVQSQVTTATSGQGGTLSLIAGNATGTTSTGGALNLASGSGTTANGVINFQPGGTTQMTLSADGKTLQWVSTIATPTLNQATTGGASGQTLTVQAQNAATTGGDLSLTSGTGGTTNGNVNLQVGGTTTASVVPNKFVLNKGWRRNVTAVSTTYQVLVSDDFIAATTSSAYTVTMPASPTTGDSYTFKDASGGAGTNTLTISGNGVNIDGSASIVLNQAYAAVTLTYTGSQWSVT